MTRLFFHFARRDFLDASISWAILALLTLGGVIFGRITYVPHDPFVAQQLNSAGSVGFGFLFYFFAVLYSNQVWSDSPLSRNVVARTYLLSLPVSRRRMFWLCFARGLVGALPLTIYAGIEMARAVSSTSFGWADNWPALQYFVGALFVLAMIAMLETVTLGGIEMQKIPRIPGRKQRIHLYLTCIALFVLDFVIFSLPTVLLPAVQNTPSLRPYWWLAFLTLPYFAWRMRRHYRDWLWE